jgi:signal peptidase I
MERKKKAIPANASSSSDFKSLLKRFWRFLWYEDSIASWIVSIALAFVLIKFILYPLLGLVMGTQFPVVAVVSDSMEHTQTFDAWWTRQEDYYLRYNITKNEFTGYPMPSGFNKGDLIVLVGVEPSKVQRGQVIVFWGGKAYPIIHRVVGVYEENTPYPYYATKGDNNLGQIINPPYLDERHVASSIACNEDSSGRCQVLLGRALVRIPYLGWVKIGFVNLLNWIGIPVA